jgi:hypothetical protein
MAQQREREIIDSFIGFADSLVDDFDVLDLTIQLTEDCARLLDVAAAGLLLADAGGVLHLLSATSEQARSLEVFQLQREEGPCLECYRSGVSVNVDDLASETSRWPRFTAAAAEQGFAAVHAIPMRLRTEVLGTLGLFGSTTGALADDDVKLARALAHVASIALVHPAGTGTRGSVLPSLQRAVASRGAFEMAKGVLSELHGLAMEDASSRLRAYAHTHGLHLTDVARRITSVDHPKRGNLLAELGDAALAQRPRQNQ